MAGWLGSNFTAQLDQIKTVSLASLLCKNMDQNNMIPR